MPITIVKPGGEPSGWVSEEHQTMAIETIDSDGVYTDTEGNRFQFKKGHVLAPGQKATLSRAGDFPAAQAPGVAELATTVPSADEAKVAKAAAAKAAADAKAQVDADAKAAADKAAADAADAAAKAATAPANKAAVAPENKSA